MHVDTLPSNLPPTQFTWYTRSEHLRPVYFRYLVHFRLFSFKQGPSSAAASTNVKGIIKSISNNNTQTVSSELGISLVCLVRRLHVHHKGFWSWRIVTHVTIVQNFWLPLFWLCIPFEFMWNNISSSDKIQRGLQYFFFSFFSFSFFFFFATDFDK